MLAKDPIANITRYITGRAVVKLTTAAITPHPIK